LRIDEEMLEAAVKGAPEGGPPPGPTDEEMAAWLATLPSADKDGVLLRILRGDLAEAGRELQGRFRQGWRAGRRSAPESAADRRTVGRLLETRDEMSVVLERRAAEEQERERRRKEQERLKARDRRLATMQGRDAEFLRKAEGLLDGRQRSKYPEIA